MAKLVRWDTRIKTPAHPTENLTVSWQPPWLICVQGLRFSHPTQIENIQRSYCYVAVSDADLARRNASTVDLLYGQYTEWRPECVRQHLVKIGEEFRAVIRWGYQEAGWVELIWSPAESSWPAAPVPPTRPRAPELDERTPPSIQLPSPSALRREKQIADCRDSLRRPAPARFADEVHDIRRKR